MVKNIVSPNNIIELFQLLNDNKINYVLKKNDGNIIPMNMPENKDLDILVHPNDYVKIRSLLIKHDFNIMNGMSCKYFFVYSTRPDMFFCKGNFKVHIFDKLACISYTNYGDSVIPLHNDIQKDIWATKKWNNKYNYWIMSDENILMYLIVRAVFDKKAFKEQYIREIEKRISIVEKRSFKDKLNLIFFKFTDQLIYLLKNKEYQNILFKYTTFDEY